MILKCPFEESFFWKVAILFHMILNRFIFSSISCKSYQLLFCLKTSLIISAKMKEIHALNISKRAILASKIDLLKFKTCRWRWIRQELFEDHEMILWYGLHAISNLSSYNLPRFLIILCQCGKNFWIIYLL